MLNISQLPNASLLCSALPNLFSCTQGEMVTIQSRDTTGVAVSTRSDQVVIESSDLSLTLYALGRIIAGETTFENENAMPFRGLMLDASRNGVPKVAFLKSTIVQLALLGMNHFCLYTEDTFQVDGEPLIGFGRGAYSKDEIRELVEFSAQVGVTMFPCFQTLGHLEQILKYQKFEYLHDNHRVLNTNLDETYEFIETLIDEIREPYDTNLIHLGMDEPWGIGRGKSFNSDDAKAPSQMYVEHVARVTQICEGKGLEGIIWGDYVLGHPEANTVSDDALSSDELCSLPKSMILDYWNYFDIESEPYERDITALQSCGYQVIASPGLQTWNNFWGQLELCEQVTTPFIESAAKLSVSKAMMTVWGDDGHECLFHNNWAALAHFFALTTGDQNDDWKLRLNAVTGTSYESYAVVSKIESPEISSVGSTPFTPTAKMLFYDDPVFGYVNQMCDDASVAEYYFALAFELEQSDDADSPRLRAAALFSRIIADKFTLIRTAKEHYKQDNRDELKRCCELSNAVVEQIKQFRILYRQMWMAERKPFGFEVLDNRFGGMIARLDTLKSVLELYISGEISKIDEFEYTTCNDLTYKDLQFYPKIATRSFSIW